MVLLLTLLLSLARTPLNCLGLREQTQQLSVTRHSAPLAIWSVVPDVDLHHVGLVYEYTFLLWHRESKGKTYIAR
jgi:hypothetical protein